MGTREARPAGSLRFAAAVAIGYAAFGVAWILLSDRVLHAMIHEARLLGRLQSVKGTAFIAASAVALFIVLWRTSVGTTRHLLRRAEEVSRLGDMIGGLTAGSFAVAACAALRRATGAERVAFLAADEAGRMLALETADGFPPGVVERARPHMFFRFGEPRGIAGAVAAVQESRYVPDAAVEPDWIPADPTVRCAYFAPVAQAERVFGVLAVFGLEADSITPSQRALTDLVAGLAATALAQARLAGAELRADRAYRELVEHSPAGIFRLALDGTLLAANPAVAASAGFADSGELLAAVRDRPAVLFTDPGELDRLLAALRADGHVALFETTTRGRGGAVRWMLLTARVVRDADGVPLYYEGTSLDITARKRAEQALAQAQDRLVRQERLSALGEMAAIVAHDFNNALAPIGGYAELLEDVRTPRTPEATARFAATIRRAAADAARIVARLREFARPGQVGPRDRVACTALFEETIELTAPRWRMRGAAAGVTYRVHGESAPETAVMGDEGALREALVNLVFNAVDASSRGGTITLRARSEGGWTVLEVADQGDGMEEEVRRRCLEPFFTTKGKDGTGLGLASVARIVADHGGTLDIRSVPGLGTTFVLSLPAG